MFIEGVGGFVWLTLLNMYSQATSSVRLGHHTSAPFPVKEGMRQGCILSTTHCMLYNNDLLHMLQYSGIDPFPIIGFYLYHVISADQSNNWTTSGM